MTPVGRFAPTPSGPLHPGNVLCAMLCWLSARSRGGKVLLRIEDVDVPRCPRRLADQVLADLAWLGFDWDAPLLYQSERGAVYAEALGRLQARGLVYPCFCTRAQLHAEAAPNLGDTQYVYPGTCARLAPEEVRRLTALRSPAWRLRVPDEDIAFTDGLYGEYRENLARDCGDFVLRRSDGLYGYQLAAVVDDAATGVSEVVRGRDILSATPRQIYLLRCLGAPQPRYVHIPLMTGPDGRRLAKRDRALSVAGLSKRFRPEEVLGQLAFAAGLRDAPAPASLPELAREFRWDLVRREDVRLPAALAG